MLIRTYDGHDVVIPSAAIEELGVKPGDKIIVRPDIVLKASHLSVTEKERRMRVLSALYGAWSFKLCSSRPLPSPSSTPSPPDR